ncbi:P-loop containing nucleoside triphosphate hydrolase protein [Punctularia strigosozonata HHB-11173 SS5]|uniref:P-loop containing nucleoside triphosphate hydrolase protein n=1 Tax=Punctularia strigosozonata (strain HHB-11173) TaxID=741275 RepID=UPI0004417741|nr:P-loop containing nucleoside triphosphate hydrolase protein [Punctularia strigosozonata HHB-11173 SS5]EIN12117.1 P-loop containing nucleoside triphosphate hydrolase protein [Punctularia strigosozonata HHB-11173 SS5]
MTKAQGVQHTLTVSEQASSKRQPGLTARMKINHDKGAVQDAGRVGEPQEDNPRAQSLGTGYASRPSSPAESVIPEHDESSECQNPEQETPSHGSMHPSSAMSPDVESQPEKITTVYKKEGQIRRCAILDSINLVINEPLRLLVCTSCSRCLGTGTALEHVRQHLPRYGAAWQLVEQQFHRTVSDHPYLLAELPDPPTLHWTGPFQCVQSTKGFACKERLADGTPCRFFSTNYKNRLRKHYSASHKDCARPPRQADDETAQLHFVQYVQSLVPLDYKTRFLVTGPYLSDAEAQPGVDRLQRIRDEMQQMNEVSLGASPKLIPYWLTALKWPEHVQGYNSYDLCRLVDAPNQHSDPLAGVSGLVFQYLKKCESLIPNCPPIVLQLLVTADAQSELEHKPFKALQEAASLAKYSRTVAALLLMILRQDTSDPTAYSIPGCPPNSEDLETLRKALESTVGMNATTVSFEDPLMLLMHHIFSGLFLRAWDHLQTTDNAIPHPVMRCIILLSIRPNGQFKEAVHVTPLLSHMQYAIRLCALQEIYLEAASPSARDLEMAALSIREFYTSGGRSAFGVMKSQGHLITDVAMSSQMEVNIIWTDPVGFTSLVHKGHEITLRNLHALYASLQAWTKAADVKTSLGCPVGVVISAFKDDMTSRSQGYSFLSDPRNRSLHSKIMFFDAIMSDPTARKWMFISPDESDLEELQVDVAHGFEWLRSLADLERNLLIMTMDLSGPPPRLTELVSLEYLNGPYADSIRGLRFFGKYLTITTQYRKQGHSTAYQKEVPRPLDAFTADLLVKVLAVYRPFAAWLSKKLWPADPKAGEGYQRLIFSDFKGQPFDPEALSTVMSEQGMKVCGAPLGVNAKRHALKAFRRDHMALHGVTLEVETQLNLEHIDAMGMGHSDNVDRRIYARSNTSDGQYSGHLLQASFERAAQWQVVMRVVPAGVLLPFDRCGTLEFESLCVAGHFRDCTKKKEDSDRMLQDTIRTVVREELQKAAIDTGLSDQILRAIREEITSAVKAAVKSIAHRNEPRDAIGLEEGDYPIASEPDGNEITENGRSSPLDIETDSPVSQAPELEDDTGDANDPQSQCTQEGSQPEAAQIRYWKPMVRKEMQILYGEEANFRSTGQCEAIYEMLMRRNDMQVVLGTGAGKTTPVIIAGLLDQATTVLAVPLKVLMEDAARKLQRAGVEHHIWREGRIPSSARVVIVSYDHIGSASWKEAITSHHFGSPYPVTRFVLDEAHSRLTQISFRPSMENVWKARMFNAQLIALTATLPPAAEDRLAELLLQSNPIVIREPTVRPEHRYIMENEFATSLIPSRIKRMIGLEMAMDSFDEAIDRILIFVPSISYGNDVAKYLGCNFYRSAIKEEKSLSAPARLKLEADRQEMLRTFEETPGGWLVATSALGAGYDYAHIRCVVVAYHFPCILELVQQIGRGGRDGRPCPVYFMPAPISFTPKRLPPGEDLLGHNLGLDLAKSQECIRWIISSCVDVMAVRCSEVPGAMQCSRCEHRGEIDRSKECATSMAPDECFYEESLQTRIGDVTDFAEAQRKVNQKMIAESAAHTDMEERILRALRPFADCCIGCWFMPGACEGKPDVARHESILDCGSITSFPGARESYLTFSKGIKYEAEARKPRICWFCHIPQSSERMGTHSWRASCQWNDIVTPFLWNISRLPDRGESLWGGRYNLPSYERWISWLVRRDTEAPWVSNIVRFFVETIEQDYADVLEITLE